MPRELPAGIRHFTGRGGELKELTALLDRAGGETPAVLISAIGGTAGVGKTALAVQWAHRVADRFPDGQLYVNLRGYDPSQPMSAADALAGFLRSLGVPGPGIPAGEDERAACYRSLLAGKRMLVVADNAGSVEQVRPLLPGSPACVVLVTSRDALAGLVARDGAHRLDLDLLPLADAVSLLRALIGERVDADPEAAAALAGRCARLPLAVRVAAEFAAARPGMPLAGLAGELAGQQQRLDRLEAGGDRRTAVRAVFSWSYRHLDPGAARLFRLAGLHPGPGFDPYAAAALASITVEQSRVLLGVLARAHLLQPAGAGRYSQHDLLRAYAAEQAGATDSGLARYEALTGLFDYYQATAAAAMDALLPAEKHQRPQLFPPARPGPPLLTLAAARDWLDTERACLVAMIVYAAAEGWPGHATVLAAILYRYLTVGWHLQDAQTVCAAAWQAAGQTGDLAAQADALRNLGHIDGWQRRYQQAAGRLGAALELYRRLGDRLGQAQTLSSLGSTSLRQSRLEQGAGQFRQALVLCREIGDRQSENMALNDLGVAEYRLGHYEQAANHYRETLTIARELGDRRGEGLALANLGEALYSRGHYEEAEDHLGRALAIVRETGDRGTNVDVLKILGLIHLEQGRYQPAAELHRQSLALVRELGDRLLEARLLNSLGEALSAAGLAGQARRRHQEALALACEIDDEPEQARAREGLARARPAEPHRPAGQPG